MVYARTRPFPAAGPASPSGVTAAAYRAGRAETQPASWAVTPDRHLSPTRSKEGQHE